MKNISKADYDRMLAVAIELDRLDAIDEITNLGGTTEDADNAYNLLIEKVSK